MKVYIIVDVGCLECEHCTNILAVVEDKALAEAYMKEIAKNHCEKLHYDQMDCYHYNYDWDASLTWICGFKHSTGQYAMELHEHEVGEVEICGKKI